MMSLWLAKNILANFMQMADLRLLIQLIMILVSTFLHSENFHLVYVNGKMIAMPIEFGANGLAYNTSLISASEASSYTILMSEK